MGIIAMTQNIIRVWRDRKLVGKDKKVHQIVVTSSLAGRIASPGQSAYSATKHAIQGFFDGLRGELVKDNIDITMICPGHIPVTEHSGGGICLFFLLFLRNCEHPPLKKTKT